MKRVIFIIVLILTLSQTLTSNAEEGKIYVNLDRTINIDETVKVTVNVKGLRNIYGIKIYIQYDNNYLEAVDKEFVLGELIDKKSYFTAINDLDEKQGKIRFMGTYYGKKEGIEKDGELLSFKFRAKQIGETEIKIVDLELLNKNGSIMNCNIIDTIVTIVRFKSCKTEEMNNKQDVYIEAEDVENFTIQKLVIHKIDDKDINLVSNIYEITYKDGNDNSQIKDPIKISIKYNKIDNMNEDKLGVYYLNEEMNKWIFLGGELDTQNQQLTFITNHLTKFAVFENPNFKEFKDLKNHWVYNYIKRLIGLNVLNGYGDNTFRPERYVSRSEFSKMIVLALNFNVYDDDLKFNDSDEIQDWAIQFISTACKNGILKGYDDGSFKPNKTMTRSELAVALGRVLNEDSDYEELQYYDADDIPGWAKDAIIICTNKGILNGYEDNTIRPNNPVTRAEAAKMIYKLLWEMRI